MTQPTHSMPLFDVEPIRTGKTQEHANPFANAAGRFRIVQPGDDLKQEAKARRESIQAALAKSSVKTAAT